MKISILCSNLSNNCAGRSYILAKLLQKRFDVQIVGPIFGDGIWEPLSELQDVEYRSIKFDPPPKCYRQIIDLYNQIDGDVIYANKLFFASTGLGLWKKLFARKPLVVDIDDWDRAIAQERIQQLSRAARLKAAMRWFLHLHKFYKDRSSATIQFFEMVAHFADQITVSNSFLQKRFGGTIVWHARDTDYFNPDKYDKLSLRRKHQISESAKAIMFFGTPRPHKGLQDLVKAIGSIDDPNVLLTVVGLDKDDDYCNSFVQLAKDRLGTRFLGFGFQPFQAIPEFLALADVIVIPQQLTPTARGQTPAKVFDAMAMSKPIISTHVSDLPKILDGCGWIIEPDNISVLTDTIRYVLAHPDLASEMGKKARKRCIENYSFEAMRKVLYEVFGRYE